MLTRNLIASFNSKTAPSSVPQWREGSESMLVAEHAFQLAAELDINKLLVHVDALHDLDEIRLLRRDEQIIWITMGDLVTETACEPHDRILRVSGKKLTRMSQLRVCLFLALIHQYIDFDERIICVSGMSGTVGLDAIVIMHPYRDFSWIRGQRLSQLREVASSKVFERVIDIALHFSAEGREGRPIGTILVIGDQKELKPHCEQLILNPLKGHPKEQRSLMNPHFRETLRELSALDGAVIINGEGVVESAGTYLNVQKKRSPVRAGFGARHTAAAALCSQTQAVAVVISESSGGITVFYQGRMVLELERPTPSLKRPDK